MHMFMSQLDAVVAQRLAAYLREHGVLAGVFHSLTSMGGYDVVPPGSSVVLFDKRDCPRAEVLAQEYESLPSEPLGEDDARVAVDLSLLGESVEIRCPSCAESMPGRDDPAHCRGCGRAIDATALVVEQHGPEALDACVADATGDARGDALTLAEETGVPCPACSYWLGGLPARGECPECGRTYDKSVVVQGFLNDLASGRFLGGREW